MGEDDLDRRRLDLRPPEGRGIEHLSEERGVVGGQIPKAKVAHRWGQTLAASPLLAAAASRAFDQSALNWTMPLSVSGWWTICWRTLKGSVATWAPARAAWVTWSGCRIEAARTSVSSSWI